MTKIITFSDGFTTNTTPTITQEIEVDTLILPNQTQDEILSVDVNGEVVSTGVLYTEINEKPNHNYCINGNFDYWQRGTSSSSNGYKTADRFLTTSSGSAHAVSRQASAGTESFRAKYFHRVIVTSSAGAGNYSYSAHKVEDVRTFSNEPVTISFWAKADASKNIAVEQIQYFGTGGSPSANVSADVETIALTTSWQKFTITSTIPSISAKTIGTNEDSSFWVAFWYDAGSTYNSNTNSLGQQSGTFDIAQVKIEKGSSVTPFYLSGITKSGELRNCMRYCQKSYSEATDPATSTTTNMISAITRASSTTAAQYIFIPYSVPMFPNTNPTVTIYPRDGANAGDLQYNTISAGSGVAAATVASYTKGFRIETSAASGLTAGDAVLFFFGYLADNEI